MYETMQIVVAALLLAATLLMVRYLVAWRFKRAVKFVLRDLESKGAVDPAHAVDLPYAKQSIIRMGVRNYYAPAVQDMIQEGILGQTEAGTYYLIVRPAGRT